MDLFLGVDIGGTNVKMAPVSKKGKMGPKFKRSTRSLCEGGDFVASFIQLLEDKFEEYPSIKRIGIGVPGMISKNREVIREVANIPELDGEPMYKRLKAAFPKRKFFLENDAAAAALGELRFSKKKIPDTFIFLTLGTGIGGGLVMDGKIFKGGNGNSMEIGHIVSRRSEGLEQSIGKKGLLAIANQIIERKKTEDPDFQHDPFTNFDEIEDGALAGNEIELEVYANFGQILGEGIVTAIRLLDVNSVIIGGGVSKCYKLLKEETVKTMHKHLSGYYMDDLFLEKATLGNKAGILGAASLCF